MGDSHYMTPGFNLLALLWSDLRNENAGWATKSLLRSVNKTVFTMVAAWQAVMFFASFASLGWSGWLLASAHGLLGILVLSLINKPREQLYPVIPIAMGLLAFGSLLASGEIDSVLVFAACWLLNSSAVVAGLLVLGRWVVTLVTLGPVAAVGLTRFLLPEWGVDLPIAMAVTMPSIVLCCRIGILILTRMSRNADLQSATAEQAAHRAVVRRRVSLQIAEDARVLHDTAIHTLAVVANGGSGLLDGKQVREHCARDTEVLEALRSERSRQQLSGDDLKQIFEWSSLPIRRSGLSDRELDELSDFLDRDLVDGLVRAAFEVLTNAR